MLTGWRFFELNYGTDGRPVLRGCWANWTGRELAAECWITGDAISSAQWRDERGEIDHTKIAVHLSATKKRCIQHLLGDEDRCMCGIYVASAPGRVLRVEDAYSGAYAAITAWGAIRPYEDGWRVENARIEHLWLPSFSCYGETCSEMVAWIANGKQGPPSDIKLQCRCVLDKLNTQQYKQLIKQTFSLDWLLENLQERYGVGVTVGLPPESEEVKDESRQADRQAPQGAQAARGPHIHSKQDGSLRTTILSWGNYAIKVHSATTNRQIFRGIDFVISRPVPNDD